MPRQPRLLLSHSYYHIMTRGNNRHQVFKSKKDYQYYLDLIYRFKNELPFDLYHYCLMPNHTHFEIKTIKGSDFSVFMKKLNLAYFFHYQKCYSWVGHFWQDRYKSQPVGKDDYFIQCGKYIEENSKRKGLVKDLKDYQFSSYRYYAFGEPNRLITEDFLYEALGESKTQRQKQYRNLIIDDLVKESYLKKAWASPSQYNNETQKMKYNLTH